MQQFAMAYDGYRLHGLSQAHLNAAIDHVLDHESLRLRTTRASTEDLRAALFSLGRRAAHGWDQRDNINQYPATQDLLDELARRHPMGVLSLSLADEGYGATPPSYELESRLASSLTDLVLFAALQLPKHLEANQLAWLGLTSKPELAVRDRLGWLLQESLTSVSVAREWKRSDLALLQGGEAQVIIEGKAMYGFDALSATSRSQYVQRVTNDLNKGRALAPDAYLLATVLMTTVTSPWPSEHDSAVAYAAQNRATAKLGSVALDQAVDLMFTALRPLGQVGVVDLGSGVAFDAEVTTTMFLVRPPSHSRI